MVKLVGVPREGAGRAERGRRPTAGLWAKMRVQNLSLSLSLSLAP